MRDLTIRDWPMFDRVVRDPKVCAMMLETILGIEVGHIEYIDDEHSEKPYLTGRGVRMDVFAKSGNKVYDIEMQSVREPHIARRMRYYQACMDTASLPKGAGFDGLPESYIIFLCDYDPFDQGLPRYTLEHACREATDLDLKDGMHWIALNAPAWDKAHDESLSRLLQYVHTGRVEGDLAITLDEQVRLANTEEPWKELALGFMTPEMDMQVRLNAAREEGIAEGLAEGEAKGKAKGLAEGEAKGKAEGKTEERDRFQTLIAKLSSEGRLAELESVVENSDALNILMVENGL